MGESIISVLGMNAWLCCFQQMLKFPEFIIFLVLESTLSCQRGSGEGMQVGWLLRNLGAPASQTTSSYA